MPRRLAAETIAAAIQSAKNNAVGSAVPAAVSSLVHESIWSTLMTKWYQVGLLLLAVGVSTALAVAVQRADEDTKTSVSKGAAVSGNGAGGEPSLAEKFARIRAEYDAKLDGVSRAVEKAKDQREINLAYTTMSPDEVVFTRRMIELAESAPADPVARDALIWVVNKPGMFDVGEYGDKFARAAALLSAPSRRRPRGGSGGAGDRQHRFAASRCALLRLLRGGEGARGEGAGSSGAGAIP